MKRPMDIRPEHRRGRPGYNTLVVNGCDAADLGMSVYCDDAPEKDDPL